MLILHQTSHKKYLKIRSMVYNKSSELSNRRNSLQKVINCHYSYEWYNIILPQSDNELFVKVDVLLFVIEEIEFKYVVLH